MLYVRDLLENMFGSRNTWHTSDRSIVPIIGPKFGLELEVEGENLPRRLSKHWTVTRDGSLRDLPESYEYKTKPLSLEGIKTALDVMQKSSAASKFNPSFRTSTHLHINVQDMSVTSLANFIAIYLLLEGSLYSLCGEHRRGNAFCIPLVQCDDILRRFGRVLRDKNSSLMDIASDGDKYSALSLRSIYYYGTLEVRTHEGVKETEMGRVFDWVSLFARIREISVAGDYTPLSILQEASSLGPEDFTKLFLGNDFVNVDTRSFWDGIAACQYFANSIVWEGSGSIEEEETPDFPKSVKQSSTDSQVDSIAEPLVDPQAELFTEPPSQRVHDEILMTYDTPRFNLREVSNTTPTPPDNTLWSTATATYRTMGSSFQTDFEELVRETDDALRHRQRMQQVILNPRMPRGTTRRRNTDEG